MAAAAKNDPWTIETLEKLEARLVRTLRAHRSQEQLNRKLGFRDFNGIAKIEHGRRRMSWAEFVHLCNLCQIDLASTFREIGTPLRETRHPFAQEGKFVQLLTSGYPPSSYQRVKGWPHTRLPRLREGKTPLKLVDVLAILARNDLQFTAFAEKVSSGVAILAEFGFPISAGQETRALTDPWIGVFYSLMELKTIRGKPPHEELQKRALMDISAMSESEFSAWISWMLDSGAVTQRDGRYFPGLHQGSFAAPEATLRTLHSCMGEHLAANRRLPAESRQPGAVAFQFLATDQAGIKAMGEAIKALRERLLEISKSTIQAGTADRTIIAETAILDPSRES